MTFEACDKCGCKSPNEDGLYVANNWMKLSIVDRADGPNREPVMLDICNECWEAIRVLLGVL